MLNGRFRWDSIYGCAGPGQPDALYCGTQQVARMDERIGGGWIATLNYPDGRQITRECTSREAGRAGCEVWAARHEAELRALVDHKHLEWMAQQTWRGKDSSQAKRMLALAGNSDFSYSSVGERKIPDP